MNQNETAQKKVFGYAEATMDKAGRVILPAIFANYTGSPSTVRILREPSGACIEVRTEADFQLLTERVINGCQKVPLPLYEAVLLEYLDFCDYASVDGERRLLIPERFRKLLNAQDGKLVLTGIGDGFWIWSQKIYSESRAARQALLRENRDFVFSVAQGRLPNMGAQCMENIEKLTQV